MNWQPPKPPPRPGGPQGGQPQQQRPPQQQQKPQQAPQQQGQAPQQQAAAQPAAAADDWKSLDYYKLLQVNRDAHSTIIRYAYRFLAAMYHPDNAETGDSDRFRTITEAFRTLSDEGKRAAYDLSLPPEGTGGGGGGTGGGAKGSGSSPNKKFGGHSLPKTPKSGVSWNEIELRLAILQILLDARKQRVKSGGANPKIIMDILDTDDMAGVEFAIWYLREKGYVQLGERLFQITADGVDYIVDQLSKTQILDGVSETEKKVSKVRVKPTGANLPARTN